MAELQYTTVPGKLETFFEKVRQVRIPPKATNAWVKSIGFTSSSDRTLLTMLKFIGFAGDTGVPTDRWESYRGSNPGAVLTEAITEAYDDLFDTYPNAHHISDA
jgi:hypothetical protein